MTVTATEMLTMPYLPSRHWAVRARTFEAFAQLVRHEQALRVLDLGAGNGWLSYRLTLDGIHCVAVDVQDDDVNSLGVAGRYRGFERVVASFDALPLGDPGFDIAVFNAALHYALDLSAALKEAQRVVRPGGRIVILDSPFYARDSDGEGIYLTAERLTTALPLAWRRHRVRYPVWYELRPLVARLRRRRQPSRFDLWECVVP